VLDYPRQESAALSLLVFGSKFFHPSVVFSRLGSLFHSNAMTVHGAASEQKAVEASADVLKHALIRIV
jgi:hypothetical protein